MLTKKIVSDWLDEVGELLFLVDGDDDDHARNLFLWGELVSLLREAEPVMGEKYRELAAREALR